MSNEFNAQASYEKQIKGSYFKVLGGMHTSEKSGRSFDATRTGFDFIGFEKMKKIFSKKNNFFSTERKM